MHAQTEYLIVLVHCGAGAGSDISFCLIPNFLCYDGGLIAAKRLHCPTRVERRRNVLELDFLDVEPIVHRCCGRHKPAEIG